MLAGAAAVYFLCARFYARNWVKNLDADICFSTERAVCGDTIELLEVVTNNKWLPLPFVNVKFQVDRKLRFQGEHTNSNITDKSYKNDVFSLLYFQKITRRIPLLCTKRGIFTIDAIDVVSKGIFMDDILSWKRSIYTELVVLPEPADVSRIDVLYKSLCGEIQIQHALYEDPFAFRGIRDYQPYDMLNRINWKASARSLDLKVNQFEDTSSRHVCILLNLLQDGMLVYEDLQEESISIAAGLAASLAEAGVGVRLITNGCDLRTGQAVCYGEGSGLAHSDRIQTGLAGIDLSVPMQPMEQCFPSKDRDCLWVLISAGKPERLQTEYNRLCSEREGAIWVFPYHAGMDTSLPMCPHAKAMPWEVEFRG